MFFGIGFVGLVILALWIYCIFDVISTDEGLTRNLPKLLWLVIVIFLPTIGSISWLLLGRPERAGFGPGSSTYRPSGGLSASGRTRTIVAPDDDPRFLAQLDDRAKKLRAWEDDLKRREDELRRREEGEDPPA
jgi:hypothetical protein